jgi:plastocyanin
MRPTVAPRALARGASLLLTAILLSGHGGARPQSHVLKVAGFQFLPPRIDVSVGDSITWVNEDIVPHTATAVGGAWDSGTIASQARRTVVVKAVGRIAYVCALHPSMKGTVVAK